MSSDQRVQPPTTEDSASTSHVELSRARDRRAWLALALLAVALLPAALFPPGGDAALYYVSGQKILHQGAAHYRDIVDVKPPLIYHMYAAAAGLFGSHVASFRILDWLLQLATASGIAVVVGRVTSARQGFVAAVVYAVFYCAQSYNGTAITESYVGLLAVPMIALQVRRRTRRDFVLAGALAGVLFLLKFSLATPLAALAIAELLVFDREPLARRLRNIALASAGFAAIAALLPLYLAIAGAWPGFAEMNTFIGGYVQNQSPGVAAALREGLTALPEYFADEFSLTMLALTCAGVMLALRPSVAHVDSWEPGRHDSPMRASEADEMHLKEAHARDTQSRDVLLTLCALNLLLALGAVALEAKYRIFHLSRIIPFASILAAAGLALIAARLQPWRSLGRFARVALVVVVPVALLLSPLARYARHGAGAVLWTLQRDRGFDRLYDAASLGYSFAELRSIADRVAQGRRDGDELYVSSSVAGLVHAFAEDVPATRVYHSAFLIAPYAPPAWRAEIGRYLVVEQPRHIALHLRDSMVEMTGTPTSSAEVVRLLPGVDSLLRAAYDTALVTQHFELYERRRR